MEENLKGALTEKTKQPADYLMTVEELAQELKGSLLVLTTSSPDKRDIYRQLFSSHAKGEDHKAGLDLYYTDSGALAIAPRRTPESDSDYLQHLNEKAVQQMELLRSDGTQVDIRNALSESNIFKPEEINITGMTEDSGWQLMFDDKDTERKFIDIIIRQLKPDLREKDYGLLKKLHNTGFPGPNLKPFQEHLAGGFHAMMDMIYKTAKELQLDELRFSNSTNVSFVSPRLGKYFQKEIVSTGRLLTRTEYEERPQETAINSNFVHVPDGQAGGAQKTIADLIRDGLHTKSSTELPASYARRELTEWLQGVVGKRKSKKVERKRPVTHALISPAKMRGEKGPVWAAPDINDLQRVSLPTPDELIKSPTLKPLDDADVVVLVPENNPAGVRSNNRLSNDPTFELLLDYVVNAEVDPQSMGVPIVLDNRSGGFDARLELISDAFAMGRMMGDAPFHMVRTDEELEHTLRLIKDVRQRAPIIKIKRPDPAVAIKKPPLQTVPADGVFTVFIGGGHANNSARDLEDAKSFGYFCAENGWRIVTGGGTVEGSMGAAHTGFIQYHLDQLKEKPVLEKYKTELSEFLDAQGNYDAESIIKKKPGLIEDLAEDGHIPKTMFFAYSTRPLLDMESLAGSEATQEYRERFWPSRKPPGITFFEVENIPRRLTGLLAPGTKIFLPGSIGTDQEFEKTIKQHLAAQIRKEVDGVANDAVFSDGTPDNAGAIIVYNPPVNENRPDEGGRLDKVLRKYGLLGGDPVAATKRRNNNITIITSLKELRNVSTARHAEAVTWLENISGIDHPKKRTEIAV